MVVEENSLHEIFAIFLRVDLTEFFLIHRKHSVEITEIYSHAFLAKISWNQRIY